VKKAAGMEASSEWCGFFASDHYVKVKMDAELRPGFFHTENVRDFFHYRYDRFPSRVMKWVWAEEAWHELHAYHEARGGTRQWLPYEEISAGGTLDIRPGDTVLIDPFLTGTPTHIVMAMSYDPATSTLVTIGGNDVGYVPVAPGSKPGADPRRETAEGATGEKLQPGGGDGRVAVGVHGAVPAGHSRAAIFGVGRLSLVDFEEHPYAWKPADKPPPPLKRP
jgi:hypothetical protein